MLRNWRLVWSSLSVQCILMMKVCKHNVLSRTGCCLIVTLDLRSRSGYVRSISGTDLLSRVSRGNIMERSPVWGNSDSLWLIHDPLLGSETKCLEIAKSPGKLRQLPPHLTSQEVASPQTSEDIPNLIATENLPTNYWRVVKVSNCQHALVLVCLDACWAHN